MSKRTIIVETFGDPSAFYARVPAATVHELDIRSSMRASKISDDGAFMFLGMDPVKSQPKAVTHRDIHDAEVSDFAIFEYACAEHDIDLDVRHIDVGVDPQESLVEFQRLYVANKAAEQGLGLDMEATLNQATEIFNHHFDGKQHAVQELPDLFLPGDRVSLLVEDEIVSAEIAAIRPDASDEMVEVSVAGHGKVPYHSKALLKSITEAQAVDHGASFDPF